MLSEACKNAIRAVVYLATHHDPAARCTVRQVASAIKGPEAFVAKVLQELSRSDLISASKGPNGGMYITSQQAKHTILDIIKAIDGLDAFKECGLGLPKCSAAHPCSVHDDYAVLRDNLLHKYKTTTIGALAKQVEEGATVLHR